MTAPQHHRPDLKQRVIARNEQQMTLWQQRRFWVVTLCWPDGRRVTYAPPGGFTKRAAEDFAAKHEWPQSAFVIPVQPPEAADAMKSAGREKP